MDLLGMITSEVRPPSTREVYFRVYKPDAVCRDKLVEIRPPANNNNRIYLAKVIDIFHETQITKDPHSVAQIQRLGRGPEEYLRGSLSKPEFSRHIARAQLVCVLVNGSVRSVDRPPFDGSFVVEADSHILQIGLGFPKDGFYIGRCYGNETERVSLPHEKICGAHASIFGQTWTGKSYLAGVLIEEALQKNIPVVVVDHFGEYLSMKEPNESERDKLLEYGLQPRGFRVLEIIPGVTIRLNPYDLLKQPEVIDFLRLEPAQYNLLADTLDEVKRNGVSPDLALESVLGDPAKGIPGYLKPTARRLGYFDRTVDALEWRLRWLKRLGILGTGYDIASYVQKGQLTVVNLSRYVEEESVAGLYVSNVLYSLIEARRRKRLPPTVVVIEEAHNYVSYDDTPSSQRIRAYIRGGRHVGIGVWLISQRPSGIHGDAINVCNTHFFLRLKGADLEHVRRYASLTDEEIDDIKDLPEGVGFVTGAALKQGVKVRIRPRMSKHGGESARFT